MKKLGSILLTVLMGIWASPVSSQAPSWELAPEIRIGSNTVPEYTFTRVSDLEIGPNGSIYVAQPTEGLIRAYDNEGRFLRAMGGQGRGPGEFRSVDTLAYSPAGLLVLDYRGTRLTLFSPDGGYQADWGVITAGMDSGMIATPPRYRLADGALLVIPAYTGDRFRRLPIYQFADRGAEPRVMGTLRVGDQSRRVEVEGFVGIVPRPVSSHTLWAFPRDGSSLLLIDREFPTARSAGVFRVTHINSALDTLFSRRYTLAARRIDRTALEDSINAAARLFSTPRGLPLEKIAKLYEAGWQIPEFQAPVDRVVAGTDGSVWLRQGAFLEAYAIWMMFDAKGDLVGSVRIPAKIHVFRLSGSHVWGVEHGDFDEPYIVRLRIVR